MKKIFFIFALGITSTTFGYAQHHHGNVLSSLKKEPAIAAALSLQPLPIDLGSFYAGNWKRGILYSAAEIVLFVPAMVLISENSNRRGYHNYDQYYYSDAYRRTWTQAERERLYYLLGGYALIKIISAFDAGYSVERQNFTPTLGYNTKTQSFALSFVFTKD